MHSDFEFLKSFFESNGFPSNLISSVIKNFLDKKQGSADASPDDKSKPVRYVSLPYFGPQSDKLKNDLLALFKKYADEYCFKFILVNNFRIGSFFNYKDRLPLCSRSSVVYEYHCSLCGTKYVGSTSRTLCLRTAEHKVVLDAA